MFVDNLIFDININDILKDPIKIYVRQVLELKGSLFQFAAI